jgi:probable blue pigment (indigoidine) exporter
MAPDRRGTTIALLYGVLVTVWGLNYLFVAWGLALSPPLWLASLRAGLGALGALVFVAGTRRLGALDRRGRRDAVLLGFPNTALFFGLWFIAGRYVPPGQTAVLIYTFPLWVALLSAVLMQYRMNGLQLLSVAGGFGGVILVSQPWAGAATSLPVVPVALLLLGAISWAVGTIVFKNRFRGEEVHAANFYQLVGGTIGLLAASVFVEPQGFAPSLHLLGVVVWLGFVGTAFAYMIWFWLLDRFHAATLSAYVFLVPVVALSASVALIGERLSVPQVAGVLLVLLSIYGTARSAGVPSGS